MTEIFKHLFAKLLLVELPYIASLGIVRPSRVSTLQNVALNCLEKLCVGPPCHIMWHLLVQHALPHLP